MKIFGIEIKRSNSGLANPSQELIDALTGSPTYAGVSVTSDTALRMSAVFACVKVLSESVAYLPLILYKREGEKKKSRATSHPLYTLLHDKPNSEMTSFTFRQTMMLHLCLRGNAYAEIETDRLGRVLSLTPIPQDQYVVTPERKDGVIRYKVKTIQTGIEKYIETEKMLHLMGLSTNGLIGLSPIQQARQSIGLGLAAEEYGARFFGNGANLDGVLQHPGKLTKDAKDYLRTSWEARHAGISKSHRTAVLEEGMTYNRIGIPPEDAQFIETRKFQITDIARIFRVPPHMIGDLDRATWANIEHQSIEFVAHTLGPWLKNWEQTILWKLLKPQEQQQYYAEFLVDALLRGDTQSRYAAYATARQNGWMSANDIREKENEDPVDGGDVYLVPLNMVPADQAGSRPPVPNDGLGGPSSTRGVDIHIHNGEGVQVRERRADSQGPERRRELADVYAPVFRDVFSRIFKRERADVLRQARKANVTADELVVWLEEYYKEHPDFCSRTILPALESYADAVGRTTSTEIDAEWTGLSDEVRKFVNEYSETFGTRESISSRMRTVSTVRTAADEGNDIPTALDEMYTEWDGVRLDDDTQHETNQASNAVVKTIFALAGISIMRWAAGVTACPLCLRMDGKIVSIASTFLAAGDEVQGGEDQTPLIVERDLGHPPLHRGCRCGIEPG